jgi:hypothetical protein
LKELMAVGFTLIALIAVTTPLERVATFRSLPQWYDVFDLRGDGAAEAMGVQYYLAPATHLTVPSCC